MILMNNQQLISQGVIHGQALQLQGIKRVNPQPSFQQLSTKKVIIATINGTQRILTPVSTPQFLTMKSSSPRLLVDSSGNIMNSTSPLVLKPGVGGQVVTKAGKVGGQVATSPGSAVPTPRNPDNKTCMWKFENGQVIVWLCHTIFKDILQLYTFRNFSSYSLHT